MPIFFRIAFKYLKWVLSTFLLLLAAYLILSIVFSIIPVNKDFDPSPDIGVYIKTNGVHLAIVLPLKNELKDWTTDLWVDDDIIHSVNYISFGWGDKGFYLNTPEWSDLTVKTAVKALFLRSPSAIHIDYYKKLETNARCRLISISTRQYGDIVDFIENSLKRDNLGDFVKIEGFQYNNFDCFYEATKSYNLFFTCNTWTNKCLKKSGLKACVWTPYDKGTLYHYRKKIKKAIPN